MCLASSRVEDCVLFELTISKPSCLSTNFDDLSRNIDHLPEFIDSVVDGLYLHLGVGLEFFHCDFRRAYIAPGATKGCFAAPTIEEIVAE
jgi:hypothetical protein